MLRFYRVLWNEAPAKTWHTRGEIQEWLSLVWSREDSHFVIELTYSKKRTMRLLFSYYVISVCLDFVWTILEKQHSTGNFPSKIWYVQSFLLWLVIVPDHGVDWYDIVTWFGHLGIAVEDVRSSSWNLHSIGFCTYRGIPTYMILHVQYFITKGYIIF